MYTQVFDPVSDSLGLSSIFAALPLLVLFVLIGVVRMAAQWAALIGLSVALLVAIVIYDMPLGQALDSGLEGAAFGLFPIMWIVVNAIWIYTMTVESGHFNVLRRSFASVSDDQRIQAVIIAFCFGALIEALAGFGTPVAISAVMLLALGLQPIKAASVALVANTAPVAFGAIAIPIITLAGVTELPVDDLGAMVGRQTPLLALIVPLILIGMVDGKRGIRQAWPAAVACGVSFALAQFVCSNYISVELTDVVASLLSAGVVVALLQVWQPSEPLIGESGGPRPAIAGGATEDAKFEEMVHRRSDATHDTRARHPRGLRPLRDHHRRPLDRADRLHQGRARGAHADVRLAGTGHPQPRRRAALIGDVQLQLARRDRHADVHLRSAHRRRATA